MQGLQLTADLYRCRCEGAWLADAARLEAVCLLRVQAAGLAPVEAAFTASTGGVSGVVLMAGSHLCVHTDRTARSVTVDLLVGRAEGDPSSRARHLMDAMVNLFAPEWTEQRSLERGDGE